jgi:hypothetical protein
MADLLFRESFSSHVSAGIQKDETTMRSLNIPCGSVKNFGFFSDLLLALTRKRNAGKIP